MTVRRPTRLPKQWPHHIKSGVLHAISLASVVLSYARGRADGHHRLQVQLEQATAEIALLRCWLVPDSASEPRRFGGWCSSAASRRTWILKFRSSDDAG